MRCQPVPGPQREAGPPDLPAPWFRNEVRTERCAHLGHRLELGERVRYVFGRRAKDMQLQCWMHRNDEIRDDGELDAKRRGPRGRRKPSSDEVA